MSNPLLLNIFWPRLNSGIGAGAVTTCFPRASKLLVMITFVTGLTGVPVALKVDCDPKLLTGFHFYCRCLFDAICRGVLSDSFHPPHKVGDLPTFPQRLRGIKINVSISCRNNFRLTYTIADVAVSLSSPDVVNATTITNKQSDDCLSGVTNSMEFVLKVLKDGLSTLHIPYYYGFAIILLTVLVKAVTFPLTKKQVESTMAMRSLAPQIKAVQERYAGDQRLLTEGFFWIPSLAGPTKIAARQTGDGTSWLFPFIDGHPPLGWSDTFAYLVLLVLLVVSQCISVQIMPPLQSNDTNVKSSEAITKFLPLMIGYFGLSIPSGLSLYWFTNNIVSTTQQKWLQKYGGAKNPVKQFNDNMVKKEELQMKRSITEAIKKEYDSSKRTKIDFRKVSSW